MTVSHEVMAGLAAPLEDTRIEVTGASDDLIEVDGFIREEFTYDGGGDGNEEGDLLAFSSGVVLRIRYTDSGVWRITPIVGADLVVIVRPEDDDDNYSDRATLYGAYWVVRGSEIAKAKS